MISIPRTRGDEPISPLKDYSMTFDYSTPVSAQFTEARGADWINLMNVELREHWQNRMNETKEQYV